ncbi:MAG: hypothetical protein WCR46_15710 [Deltaproteobacteria bacterium]|jgi:hypothetical protein
MTSECGVQDRCQLPTSLCRLSFPARHPEVKKSSGESGFVGHRPTQVKKLIAVLGAEDDQVEKPASHGVHLTSTHEMSAPVAIPLAGFNEKIAHLMDIVNGKITSKVVNPDGSPMVVYHGTTADFNLFENNNVGAFFFTPGNRSLDHVGGPERL